MLDGRKITEPSSYFRALEDGQSDGMITTMMQNLHKIFLFTIWDHSLSTYAKSFRKTNTSYPLIRTRTRRCAHQEVRNVNFLEKNLLIY